MAENLAGRLRVAFQGEPGAFSEEAALALLGDTVDLVPRPTFDALFAAVDEHAADALLAPIENTLAGSVAACYDLLLDTRLAIVGEVVIRVAHHLIGVPGAKMGDVTTVESHPVALAQCEAFFRSRPAITRLASNDTTGSVRAVVAARDRRRAAIAGERAARVYGGEILARHLEDSPHNYTRFILLTRPPAAWPPDASKTSLVIGVPHEPGGLARVLSPLADRGLNLLKIEGRPVKGRPWEYHFFLDVDAAPDEPRLRAALDDIGRGAQELRVLGAYRAAETSLTGANSAYNDPHSPHADRAGSSGG